MQAWYGQVSQVWPRWKTSQAGQEWLGLSSGQATDPVNIQEPYRQQNTRSKYGGNHPEIVNGVKRSLKVEYANQGCVSWWEPQKHKVYAWDLCVWTLDESISLRKASCKRLARTPQEVSSKRMKNLECDGEILLNKHINADASDLSPMHRCCLKPARRKTKTCFPPTKASSFVVLLLLLLPSAICYCGNHTSLLSATTLAGTSSMSCPSSVGLYYILGCHK